MRSFLVIAALAALLLLGPDVYPWPRTGPGEPLAARIAPPAGFVRAPAEGFARWLRNLPLRPGRPPIRDRKGNVLPRDPHLAVVDLDVLPHQECADSAMRLRAEWLRASGRDAEVHFRFTSGDEASLEKWQKGFRPLVAGNRVTWRRSAAPDRSDTTFRAYLTTLFNYAGSASLEKETTALPLAELAIGDLFVQGGFPGHVVVVVDVAEHPMTHERVFLLAQGFMPAQDFHVVRGPRDGWFPLDFGATLVTPDWTFRRDHLRRFAR